MARFKHAVTLDAVPSAWFRRLVSAGHERVQSLLPEINGPDSGLELDVSSWDPHADTAGRLTATDETAELACRFLLRTAAAPATVACDGQVHSTEPKQLWFLRTTSWTARAELARWWQGSGHIKVALHNKIAQGELKIAPTHVDARLWKLTVTTKMRGRSWARPLIAITLPFLRATLDRKIAEILDKAATRWHHQAPTLLAQSPETLVDDLLAKLQQAENADPPTGK